MKKKLVIFDLDGVLVDTFELQKYAFKNTYSALCSPDYESSFAEFVQYSGIPLAEIFQKMKLPIGFMDMYVSCSKSNLHLVSLYKNSGDLLIQLKNQMRILAIISGKEENRIHAILQKFEIGSFFEDVIGGDSTLKGKPNPGPVLHLLKKNNLEKKDAIFVGDSWVDVLCAKNAGIESIGVSWGENTSTLKGEYSPDFFISNWEEISKYI